LSFAESNDEIIVNMFKDALDSVLLQFFALYYAAKGEKAP